MAHPQRNQRRLKPRQKAKLSKISENLCSIRNDTNCPLTETLTVYKIRPFSFKRSALVVGTLLLCCMRRRQEESERGKSKAQEGKSESDDMKFLILTRWFYFMFYAFYRRLSAAKKVPGNHRTLFDLMQWLWFHRCSLIKRAACEIQIKAECWEVLIKFMHF